MPSLCINYNPAVGPLIQVGIFLSTNILQDAMSSTSPANINNYLALIDTGASHTAISQKVINDLTLPPVGKQQVGGVHGAQSVNMYQFIIGLIFPNVQLPSGAFQANITAFPVNGTEFIAPSGFDVLLGRDVLCKGVFSMSFDGHAIFSV